MWIIAAPIRGINYYVKILEGRHTPHYHLEGLQDNATHFATKADAETEKDFIKDQTTNVIPFNKTK